MRRLLIVTLAFLAFIGCKKDVNNNSSSNNSNSNNSYDVGGVWQCDSWMYNGSQLLDNYTAYILICEVDGSWGTAVFDLQDNLTEISTIGTFTINSDKTSGTFTQEYEYNPITDSWDALNTPLTLSVTINKLDDDELDITFSYSGNTDVITTVITPDPEPC